MVTVAVIERCRERGRTARHAGEPAPLVRTYTLACHSWPHAAMEPSRPSRGPPRRRSRPSRSLRDQHKTAITLSGLMLALPLPSDQPVSLRDAMSAADERGGAGVRVARAGAVVARERRGDGGRAQDRPRLAERSGRRQATFGAGDR